MKLVEQLLFFSILIVLSISSAKILSKQSSKSSLLHAQEKPRPSASIAKEQREVDMKFNVEDQELIVLKYAGRNSKGKRIQSYFMVFSSGNIGYWRYHGKGVYLYNNKSDTWIFAKFASRDKSLVKNDDLSLQRVNHQFEKTYKKTECSPLKIYDEYWKAFYNTCQVTLTHAIKKYGNEKVRDFQKKYLRNDSLKPIMQLSGFHKFLNNEFVFTHRWFYFSDKKFNRNLDLTSIQYYGNRSEASKALDINIPNFNLYQHSKYFPSCTAFKC